MPESSLLAPSMIASALESCLPGRTVEQVEDRGVWIRHTFRARLDSEEVVYLKADLDDSRSSEKEAYLCDLLASRGLPAPRVLAFRPAGDILPAPFIVQARVGGRRLGDLLKSASPEDRRAIYACLGRFYRGMHAVSHPHSGWMVGAGEVLPFSPARHQFDEVILRIGQQAVEQGLLSAGDHARLVRLWSENLARLDEHTPALVCGALHWTVYLEREGGGWRVSKLTDMVDMLFWDPAWDLASLRFPAFMDAPGEPEWSAFCAEYGPMPDAGRIGLYALLQRVDAAMGNYLEPASPEHARWKEAAWAAFPAQLAEAERLLA